MHLATDAADELLAVPNHTRGPVDGLQAAINTALSDDLGGDLAAKVPQPLVASKAEAQTLANAPCEAAMVPLPEDNAEDSPSLSPAAEGTIVQDASDTATTVPLPADNDGDFPPAAATAVEHQTAAGGPSEPAIVPPPEKLPETVSLPTPNADAPADEKAASVAPTPVSEPEPKPSVPAPVTSGEPKVKAPEPGPVSELHLAAATPLPDDRPGVTFHRASSIRRANELKTLFTDIYTRESWGFHSSRALRLVTCTPDNRSLPHIQERWDGPRNAHAQSVYCHEGRQDEPTVRRPCRLRPTPDRSDPLRTAQGRRHPREHLQADGLPVSVAFIDVPTEILPARRRSDLLLLVRIRASVPRV